MNELSKIWINARYEVITLLRSWFFRIFAGLMLGLFVMMNIIFFSTALPIPRMFNGFSASVPYANMLLLNLAQISIVIFMASDFFKRDRKFNTVEVFYIRSMTNAAYIIGKALGIGLIFLALDVLILLIACVIHLAFSDVTFTWKPYFLYPLIMGLPAFLFMTGLSFLLMRLIKNQAVVILGLLGYYAATLFYLNNRAYYLFDLIGLRIPLAYSDFTGIADFNQILMQRAVYLFLGLFFIAVTIVSFNRLVQSLPVRRAVLIFAILSVSLSGIFIYGYLSPSSEVPADRLAMKELNKQYFDKANMSPVSCRIAFNHHGNTMTAKTRYVLQNKNPDPVEMYYFSINPGLEVTRVSTDTGLMRFKQTRHILEVYPSDKIVPGGLDSLTIEFEGRIDDAVCYLDISDELLKPAFTIWVYNVPCKYAFLERDYVLLPPESLWYPRPGLPPGTGFPERLDRQFTRYHLEVRTNKKLMAISQGEMLNPQPGSFSFSPEVPLQDISLVIGPYHKQSIEADSISYLLYALPGHDYYTSFLTEVEDTLSNIIREVKQDYEVRLNLSYPFQRLGLVEVPIQYYAYARIWTAAEETVQPEQIWIQENAAAVTGADFRLLNRSMDRRMERSNQTLTEKERQISMLKSFFNSTFLDKAAGRLRFGGPRPEKDPYYSIFPNYYSYVTVLESEKGFIFNTALESYLNDRAKSGSAGPPQMFVEGLTDAEKVSRALEKKSLAEYLADPDSVAFMTELIKQKGSYLVKLLKYELGGDVFDKSLRETVGSSLYKPFSLEALIDESQFRSDVILDSYLHNWYRGSGLPAFRLYDVALFKVIDKDHIRNQIRFKIFNSSAVDGLIEVTFQYGRGGRGMPFGFNETDEPARVYRINQGELKEIGILLDDEPRGIEVNFLIGRNLPLIVSRQFDKAELDENKAPFSGERIIDDKPIWSTPDEHIVDNVNAGFEVYNPPFSSVLKRMIHGERSEEKEEEYVRFQWWRPPQQWRLVKNATLYGTYIHSAYYIGSGSGNKYVSWTTRIGESGFYDIYMHMLSKEGFWRGRGRQRGGSTFGEFNYIIHHDSGEENVTLDANQAPEGWNFLGTWYLSRGEAKVVLTDESDGRMIVADAIKWVKNDD